MDFLAIKLSQQDKIKTRALTLGASDAESCADPVLCALRDSGLLLPLRYQLSGLIILTIAAQCFGLTVAQRGPILDFRRHIQKKTPAGRAEIP